MNTRTRNQARKSTGTRGASSASANQSDDVSSSQIISPRKARKSTATRQIVPAIVPDNDPVETVSPRKARKSTGRLRSQPADNNTSIDLFPEDDDDDDDFVPSSTNFRSTWNRDESSQPQPSTSGLSQLGSSKGRFSKSLSANSSPQKSGGKSKNTKSNLSANAMDGELSSQDVDALANRCVSFILVADQKKYAIKKSDIMKHVFGHLGEKSLYGEVMEKTQKILKKTFGLEILKINNPRVVNSRSKEYMLINFLNQKLGSQEFAEYTPLELQKRGLVFYLLTLIYMNENAINEDELWKALEPLGIDVKSRTPHAIFGNVKTYITIELVKQMYLEYRCISKDPPHYEFIWGERAKQEVGKENLLKFACKIMGSKPEDWIYQYKDAEKAVETEGD